MHEDGPGVWDDVCKIWGYWLKAFGCSKTECHKISKTKKSVYHRLMKFFMRLHIEVKSRRAKFYGITTHSLAYMDKKHFFAFFGPFGDF